MQFDTMLAILLIGVLPLGLALYFASAEHRRAWRRARIQSRPFPAAWRSILRQRMPYLRQLPADARLKLEKLIQVFVAEKRFIGCDGLAIDDDMRVTIAAHACLLILNRPAGVYPELREILVYPSAFWVERDQTDEIGLVQRQRRVLSGESSSFGHVVLSWADVIADAATPDDGVNVAIHEFAHQLDQEKGYANGAPARLGRNRASQWSLVMQGEYNRLCDAASRGEISLLNHYGATAPEEFFAVISEVFFEQAAAMREQHPLLFDELRNFYRIDPTAWA
jgi:Mlc titration factor MtfA (ptsG expression regulator)